MVILVTGGAGFVGSHVVDHLVAGGHEVRVVDLLHGHASIPVRPGHAGGRYDADVSRWTIGYIIGREWEPFAVKDYDSRYGKARRFQGRFLRTRGTVSAMDAWLAEQGVAAHHHAHPHPLSLCTGRRLQRRFCKACNLA